MKAVLLDEKIIALLAQLALASVFIFSPLILGILAAIVSCRIMRYAEASNLSALLRGGAPGTFAGGSIGFLAGLDNYLSIWTALVAGAFVGSVLGVVLAWRRRG